MAQNSTVAEWPTAESVGRGKLIIEPSPTEFRFLLHIQSADLHRRPAGPVATSLQLRVGLPGSIQRLRSSVLPQRASLRAERAVDRRVEKHQRLRRNCLWRWLVWPWRALLLRWEIKSALQMSGNIERRTLREPRVVSGHQMQEQWDMHGERRV